MTTPTKDPFLRPAQVEKEHGISRHSLYQWVKQGRFPKPVELGPRTKVWRRSTIEKWFAEKEAEAQG